MIGTQKTISHKTYGIITGRVVSTVEVGTQTVSYELCVPSMGHKTKFDSITIKPSDVVYEFSHTTECNSMTCYTQSVNLADHPREIEHYQKWLRDVTAMGVRNLCKLGQLDGKAMCGDIDKEFPINRRVL